MAQGDSSHLVAHEEHKISSGVDRVLVQHTTDAMIASKAVKIFLFYFFLNFSK